MTRDEIITSVMGRLGNRTDLQTTLETEILVVQTTLESNHWLPWFLHSENESNTTVAGEERVQVPDDFLLEVDEQALWIYDADNTDNKWIELKKDDLDTLRQRYPGEGQPVAYALRGDYLVFFPTPDDAYDLRFNYYKKDSTLSTNIENNWTKHAPELVIAECCLLMARDWIKDYEAVPTFEKAVAREWSRLYRKHTAREEANRSRSMGDE